MDDNGLKRALLLALFVTAPVWASNDMSSTNYKIRRGDVNSGGSAHGTSASYNMTNTVGKPGGGHSLFTGTTYFVYSGFANIVSHPDSIEDLSVLTYPSTGSVAVSWTAPTAYASTGTATSYAVRYRATPFANEVDFVTSTIYPNSWAPLPPGGLESRVLTNLAHNTTYYFAVKGVDVAGNTGYLSNTSGASTLTDELANTTIIDVGQSSVTLTWTGLGAAGSQGYLVEASTLSNFSGTIRSTTTSNTFLNTLTVFNLRRGKFTYLQAGGLNWNGVPNFGVALTTTTLPGPPPLLPVFTAVYTSSIAMTWGDVVPDVGYIAEASAASNFAVISQSSATLDIALSSLTIQNLSANATYYLRAGSLYDDSTSYTNALPVSTITVAAVPTAGVFGMVGPSSMTVNWNGSINAAGTNFRVELSSISATGASTATATTSALTATLTALTQDTTYWTRVQALGWAGSDSPYLFVGSSVTGTVTPLIIPTFSGFTSVQMTSVTVAWSLTGPAQIVYDVDLAPANPFGTHITSNVVAGPTSNVMGLALNSLYTARVRAHSLTSGNVSSWSNSFSTYTLAEAPTNLSTTGVANTYVWLAWSGGANPANTLYSIERSTDGVTFAQVGAVRAVTYQDFTVGAGTAYMFRVRAISEGGTPSAYTNTVLVMTSGTASAPKRPLGLWAEQADAGGGNTLTTYHWSPVTAREDGTALSNLQGYRIYTSSSLYLPKAQWTVAGNVATEEWPVTEPATDVNYYCFRAVDTGGNLSEYTQILDNTGSINHFFMAADNRTYATLPQSAANKLRAAMNTYGSNLWMSVDQVASEETGRVLRSVTVSVSDGITENLVSDIRFDPPVLRMVIGYSVTGGNVVSGAPEAAMMAFGRAPVISASNAAEQLSLFWHNGVEWIKITGLVNVAAQTVSGTGGRVGSFQIRAATHAPGATLTKVYPRIITPNGDGWNDKAVFQFDNPELLALSGKVYDISGAFVASLEPGPSPDSSLVWNGKDAGSLPVPGGIYVYQVDVGGTPETGTIVVAR